ncbi:MAG: Patatin [Gallionellales bacterium RIFCSPHIGHO2_02_FULL_57_16]|nr:MAG: Patatin [Gallionellales bacterium RIFCSPHIGHO2_02_FULL_57_16]
MEKRTGLILTGGGARAAYQVGVLKAIAEFLPRRSHSPFQIVCGTSAGALNAATLAINAKNFSMGVQYLVNTWKNFHASQIYRTDAVGVFNNTMLWIAGVMLRLLGINKLNQTSLLDNSPLIEFLEQILPCENIQENIDAGVLRALSITASGYGSGQSVTFYQGVKELVPWRRTGRMGVPTQIETKHLLASASLPFLFKPTLINREYFGDGSMRQISPIGSALHLGATRIMVIGVTAIEYVDQSQRSDIHEYPTLAQIAGHALNSIFLDHMEVDLERVRKTNDLVAIMPAEMRESTNLKHVEVMVISPSQPIDRIAERYVKELPWTIRLLLRLVGARHHSGVTLVSYLLSEKKFCRALIDMGYQDALNRRDEIMKFLEVQPRQDVEMPQ